MFFSTDICVDKSHPLHTMWLLSCYLEDEDSRSRKKKISDNTLRRSDLVKIVRELTKMFRVDGDRRGFALAMNSDMFHAVVFNLEFKAIDLLSTGRKLLATIRRRNHKKNDANQVKNLLIDLDTNFAAALTKTTCVAPRFPEGDIATRFNNITMFDMDAVNPTTTDTLAADDFGTMGFEDMEALEATLDRSRDMVNDAPAYLLPAPDMEEDLLRPGQINFVPATPPHMEEDLQGPIQINIVPATPPHMEEEQSRILQGDIAPMMNEEEHVLPFDDTNPPGRLRSSPEHRQPTDEYAEPPVLQGLVDLPNVQVFGAVDSGQVDLPAELASGQVDLPADGAPAEVARPRRQRNKKRRLLIDEVTTLSAREVQMQLVHTEPVTRVRDQPRPKQTTRSVTDMFSGPIQGFHPYSELGQYADTRFRSLKANKRRIEYSESSSDSDTEETRNINLEVPQEDDRELSSLRDGLRIDDMSSIHAISGILGDEGQVTGMDDNQLQDLDHGVSELRNAPEATIDQAQLSFQGSPAAGERGRKDSNLPSILSSRVSDEASETRPTSVILDYEIGGGVGLDVTGLPAGINVTGDHSHLNGGEAPRMDVTPAAGEENIDVDLPQAEPLFGDDVNVNLGNQDEQSEEPPATVDHYAHDRLLEVKISGPMTSAGNLLDKLKDMNPTHGGVLTFDSVCPTAGTARAEAAVSFFNILKLQKLRFIECVQDELTDPIKIQLHLQDGSEYGSVSDGFTASSD